MEELLKKYKEWKEGKEEDYVFDEIHDFLSSLSRGEIYCMLETLLKLYEKKN